MGVGGWRLEEDEDLVDVIEVAMAAALDGNL